MAYDKVVDSVALDNELTSIGNAIRFQNGELKQYSLGEMATAIASLTFDGGGDLDGGNLNPEGIINPQDYEVIVVESLPDDKSKAVLPGITPGMADSFPLLFPNWKDYVKDINNLAGFIYYNDRNIQFYFPQGFDSMIHESHPEIKQFNTGAFSYDNQYGRIMYFEIDRYSMLFTPNGLSLHSKRVFNNYHGRHNTEASNKDGIILFLKKEV